MRAELAQVRSDVQSLGAMRHELVEQLQGLKGQLLSARAEHKQANTVMADIEIMRKEIQKGRAIIEFEKNVHADNTEQIAQVAVVASANSGSGYVETYGNPGMAYAANFASPHNFHQRTADNDPQLMRWRIIDCLRTKPDGSTAVIQLPCQAILLLTREIVLSSRERSMSEITNLPRFRMIRDAGRSGWAEAKEEKLRRIWLPIARTVQWSAGRERRSQTQNSRTKEVANV
ncbi:hypothetical protein OPV22_010088 [Ensete ventricosum]|uniref:Uncharacterized protein n=1 Tax=Ensete ventricosum TaxID=4639 RepID=A0AAV8RGK9_ENSVE|nr:hypothetical protein OPV22_010088 [Ensete ventricosum]